MSSLHFAPVQGHTDAAYRHFYKEIYGSDIPFYSPFIRMEKDGVRPRDIKDITSGLNKNTNLVPQIIFRNEKELSVLVREIKALGFSQIDLNMGCPFPLQTGHGRGAATIDNPEMGKAVEKCVSENPEISFSVKMRVGLVREDEWKTLLPFLNNTKLSHITLHPRVAKQQYGGDVNLEQFNLFLQESVNPVVYNGDIKTLDDYNGIRRRFPDAEGVMIARGVLSRPSLFNEIMEGTEWAREKIISHMLEFHQSLFDHYSSVLCGDSQIISKIKPFWEYAEEEIGRKAWKAIKKAVNIPQYQTAVAMID